jgi:hypothetical protein
VWCDPDTQGWPMKICFCGHRLKSHWPGGRCLRVDFMPPGTMAIRGPCQCKEFRLRRYFPKSIRNL